MDESLNFPVKYAVLELKRNGGYSTNYEDVTVCFIVSKGYVVESKVKYFSDGNSKLTHSVVFPYNDYGGYYYCFSYQKPYREDRKVPDFNACGDYYPVQLVTELFDTYEDAKVAASNKNKELRSRICLFDSILDPQFKEKYDKAVKEFEKKLNVCHMYEQFIIDNTQDMKVSSVDLDDALSLARIKKD